MITLTYKQLYQINTPEARKLLIKAFEENNKNISLTARRLSCSRNTVRKITTRYYTKGSLDDLSRRPKHSPAKTESDKEQLVWIKALVMVWHFLSS